MFLPVYLARDFGAWSFLVFAIPNILGAAAVPFLLQSPESTRAFILAHHGAVRAFALATILFHIVFLSAFMPSGHLWLDVGIGAVTATTALATSLFSRRAASIAAVAIWALSLAFGLAAHLTAPAGHQFSIPPVRGDFGIPALLMAAPAVTLGFLLCPLLDGTFLATREFHGRATNRIFLIAFFLLFPALILLTLGYGGRIIRAGSISWWTYAHFAVQSGFTIGVHIWALRWLHRTRLAGPRTPEPAPLRWSARVLLAITGAAFGAAMFVQAFGIAPNIHTSANRFGYDLMLSLYGLVFPAYLIAIAVPPALGRRPSALVLLAVLAVAAPLYWIGSIQRGYWAIPIAVVLVLAAPFLSPRAREKNPQIA